MAMVRTQLELDPEQYEALRLLAQLQRLSVAALARQLVTEGLERASTRKLEKLRALDELAAIGREISARGGVLEDDPIAAVRAERERQLGTIGG